MSWEWTALLDLTTPKGGESFFFLRYLSLALEGLSLSSCAVVPSLWVMRGQMTFSPGSHIRYPLY